MEHVNSVACLVSIGRRNSHSMLGECCVHGRLGTLGILSLSSVRGVLGEGCGSGVLSKLRNVERGHQIYRSATTGSRCA